MKNTVTARARIGAWLWIGCLQFFIIQLAVTASWRTRYDIATNYISDLGAVHCGNFPPGGHVYVCSPWHSAMNASMILQGCLMLFGAVLFESGSDRHLTACAARSLIAIAGVGSMIVGLFPEDAAPRWHYAGAAMHLISGNLGVLLLANLRRRAYPRRFPPAFVLLVCGGVGSVATLALGAGLTGSLGIGGMERLAVYPFPLCLMLCGAATLRNREYA